MKESCGFNILSTKWFFQAFDRYVISLGIESPELTKELIDTWAATLKNNCARTKNGKYSYLTQLASYMKEQGANAYICPRFKRKGAVGFDSFVFTESQMKNIFVETDNLLREDSRLNSILFSLPCLLRLLYSTGLRISEALALRNKDVDLQKNVLRIGVDRGSKNGEARYVPISESLKSCLIKHLKYRNMLKVNQLNIIDIENPEHVFFTKLNGAGMSKGCVYSWFRKIYERCGIEFRGDHIGPRLHALRHTMATTSLNKMINSGLNVYTALPILSACLGHKRVTDTEIYVRLTCDQYPELMDKCAALHNFIYPEIKNEYGSY